MKKVILVDDEKLVAEAIRRQVDWESCGAVLCRVCLNAFDGRAGAGSQGAGV